MGLLAGNGQALHILALRVGAVFLPGTPRPLESEAVAVLQQAALCLRALS
jgi:hypothetical protein